jgi:hypothetical protein
MSIAQSNANQTFEKNRNAIMPSPPKPTLQKAAWCNCKNTHRTITDVRQPNGVVGGNEMLKTERKKPPVDKKATFIGLLNR